MRNSILLLCILLAFALICLTEVNATTGLISIDEMEDINNEYDLQDPTLVETSSESELEDGTEVDEYADEDYNMVEVEDFGAPLGQLGAACTVGSECAAGLECVSYGTSKRCVARATTTAKVAASTSSSSSLDPEPARRPLDYCSPRFPPSTGFDCFNNKKSAQSSTSSSSDKYAGYPNYWGSKCAKAADCGKLDAKTKGRIWCDVKKKAVDGSLGACEGYLFNRPKKFSTPANSSPSRSDTNSIRQKDKAVRALYPVDPSPMPSSYCSPRRPLDSKQLAQGGNCEHNRIVFSSGGGSQTAMFTGCKCLFDQDCGGKLKCLISQDGLGICM